MLMSVLTPTHDPRYLAEAWTSLQQQTHAAFEWVLVPNGNAVIPPDIAADPRVRVVPWDGPATPGVGALKEFAARRARGAVLVELDHDDMLLPDCLEQVATKTAAGAGFIYSDAAVFEDADLATWGYAKSHGWDHYTVGVWGRTFTATRAMPLCPRMLCEVYYAPDHVRAWTREAYFEAGAHDPALAVGDDHDLICRTYLAGAAFAHTGTCGYLYRRHPGNTVKAMAAQIQRQNDANRRRHLTGLTREWCRREGFGTANLLEEKKAGRWQYGVKLAFPAQSLGQLAAPDVLQFVAPEDQAALFDEIYRVLAPGGWLHLAVPHERGRYAGQNPLHRTRFNENSFLYYARREFAASHPQTIGCKFDLVINEPYFPDSRWQEHDMLMLRADLCALKGQFNPGPALI